MKLRLSPGLGAVILAMSCRFLGAQEMDSKTNMVDLAKPEDESTLLVDATKFLLPFCAREATVGTSIWPAYGNEKDGYPALAMVRAGSQAARAGLQWKDEIESIEGVSVRGAPLKTLQGKIWGPALQRSAATGNAFDLGVRSKDPAASVVHIKVHAEFACPIVYGSQEMLPADKVAKFLALNETVQRDVLNDSEILKSTALDMLSQRSTGAALHTLGNLLNLVAAVNGLSTSDTLRDTKFFTDGDHLRADFLMLFALHQLGVDIAFYPKWEQFQVDHAPKKFFEAGRREYGKSSKEKLQKVVDFILEGRSQAAADLVALKLNQDQVALFSKERLVAKVTPNQNETHKANQVPAPTPPQLVETSAIVVASVVEPVSVNRIDQLPIVASAPPQPSSAIPAVTVAEPVEKVAVLTQHLTPSNVSNLGSDAKDGFLPPRKVDDIVAIPYLNARGRERYRDWLSRPVPRAFAISPSGSYSSSIGRIPPHAGLPADPVERAQITCNRVSQMPCTVYAVDDSVVWVPPVDSAQHSIAVPQPTSYASIDDVDRVPQIGAKAKELYRDWLALPFPRAVAISEKGALARGYGANAMEIALRNCEKFKYRCQVYAVDDKVVFVPFASTNTN